MADAAWAAALAALSPAAQVVVHCSDGSGLSFSTAESRCASLHLPPNIVKQSQLLQELAEATTGHTPLAVSVEDFAAWLQHVGVYRPVKVQQPDNEDARALSFRLFKVQVLCSWALRGHATCDSRDGS